MLFKSGEGYFTTQQINIGVFVTFSVCKGREHVVHLRTKYEQDPNVCFYIVGENIENYDDNYDSFIKLVQKYNIHGLLYLNKWGETWCDSLTKGLVSGLPILYNNLGSCMHRIPADEPKYIINAQDETDVTDMKLLENSFDSFLCYIVTNPILINVRTHVPSTRPTLVRIISE